jgi:hypothetical protein
MGAMTAPSIVLEKYRRRGEQPRDDGGMGKELWSTKEDPAVNPGDVSGKNLITPLQNR